MAEKQTLTVVVNVFDDKYCDVYFFTQEYKRLCSYLMNNKTFQSFVKDLMHYPLFNTKQDDPDIDIVVVNSCSLTTRSLVGWQNTNLLI